jgi:uncharacterized secreted protein with C-terminal beta-propeller domain
VTDELDRWIRRARPKTEADDGWAASEQGEAMLAQIHAATTQPAAVRARTTHGRSWIGRVAFAAAAAAVAGTVLMGGAHNTPAQHPRSPVVPGARPGTMALAAYTDCTDLLHNLRSKFATAVANGYYYPNTQSALASNGILDATPNGAAGTTPIPAPTGAPSYSTTNVQEVGVDEPDTVKSDGERIVTANGGVLRVIDAKTHRLTGALKLPGAGGYDSTPLLLVGNRVLVQLPVRYGADRQTQPFLLVDIAARPKVVGTFAADGAEIDARMVNGTVRLVVQSGPRITLPYNYPATPAQTSARNRAIVARAPLSAWQPGYTASFDGTTATNRVPCTSISHPAFYSADSMVTVYTVDLAASVANPFANVSPISIAADGDTVYATATSLYVTSNPFPYLHTGPAVLRPGLAIPKAPYRVDGFRTQIHRFDISQPGAPRYLGSGSVPGAIYGSYALSDYDGHLRIAATQYGTAGKSSTGLYIVDDQTLAMTGWIGGIGMNEQVYAVRYVGPLAFVVTYRQVDPFTVLDLSDPAHPKRGGSLSMPGYSSYLFPITDTLILGVGGSVGTGNEPDGMKFELFDVSNPASPTEVASLVRAGSTGPVRFDPHAFLYWPATGSVVVPVSSWQAAAASQTLVLTVHGTALGTQGVITPPKAASPGSDHRSLVIGSTLWTLGDNGAQASDLAGLASQGWIPFS